MKSTFDKEKLGADIQREVVERFLKQLMQEQPDLYYTSAAQIAHAIYEQLRTVMNTLPFEEQKHVRRLSAHDIEVILSFHQ